MPSQNFTAAQAAKQITRILRNPEPGSNPPYSDTSNGNWVETFGTPITLNYAFRTSAPGSYPVSNMNGFSAMNAAQQTLVADALQKWSEVANISFVPVAEAQANFLFGNFSGDAGLVNAIDGYGGWSASWSQQSGQPRVYTRNSHVWIDSTATYATAPTLENGAYHLYQHEIGHAITLGHPGN